MKLEANVNLQCATAMSNLRLAIRQERKQLCHELESIINSYKSRTAQNARLPDEIHVATLLTKIRRVLCNGETFQPLSRSEVNRTKDLLKKLRIEVNPVAVDTKLADGLHSRPPTTTEYDSLEGDETWLRITAKRKELLFLEEPSPPECYDENQQHPTETKGRSKPSTKEEQPCNVSTFIDTADKVTSTFQERMVSLQRFLNQTGARQTTTKRCLRETSDVMRKAHRSVHQSEKSRRRAEKVRQNRRLEAKTGSDSKETDEQCQECIQHKQMRDIFRKSVTLNLKRTSRSAPNSDIYPRSGREQNANAVTKEDIEEFLASWSLSLTREVHCGSPVLAAQLSSALQSVVVARKPEGVAGRGTWATPPWVPWRTMRVVCTFNEH